MIKFQYWGNGSNAERVSLRVMRVECFGKDRLPKEGIDLGEKHLLNYKGDIVGMAQLRVVPAGPTAKRGAAPHRFQFFHDPSGRWISLGRIAQVK